MTEPVQIRLPIKRDLQFGIYRDGDNNLDQVQADVLDQAQEVSAQDPRIDFTVKDTTQRDDAAGPGGILRTEDYAFVDGQQQQLDVHTPQDMSQRKTLTQFVVTTLDDAQRNHAQATWLDLVDHGGGDGGAFQTTMSHGKVMTEDDIAGAIADGITAHAQAHPEDTKRTIDGVVLNACLMATLGVESSLSHVGVRYLAASPETMLAPGVPSTVAQDIATHSDDPHAMAQAIVHTTMSTRYGIGQERFGPAAAFDVLDLNPEKIAAMEQTVRALNAGLVQAAKQPDLKAAIKADARGIEGMTRTQEKGLPWHADRPAESLYKTLGSDDRLPDDVRAAANHAEKAIAATVMAHGESKDFAPFGDVSYRDAVGPTVHFPVSKGQIDPWAPVISETHTAFAQLVGENAVAKALV